MLRLWVCYQQQVFQSIIRIYFEGLDPDPNSVNLRPDIDFVNLNPDLEYVNFRSEQDLVRI